MIYMICPVSITVLLISIMVERVALARLRRRKLVLEVEKLELLNKRDAL